MAHVHRGDLVVVIAGKEKGKRGKVLRFLSKKDRVVVERLNMVKRHTKPSQKNPNGGIVEKEGSIHISNVAIWNPVTKKADRIGLRSLEDGRKVRFFKSNGELIGA